MVHAVCILSMCLCTLTYGSCWNQCFPYIMILTSNLVVFCSKSRKVENKSELKFIAWSVKQQNDTNNNQDRWLALKNC